MNFLKRTNKSNRYKRLHVPTLTVQIHTLVRTVLQSSQLLSIEFLIPYITASEFATLGTHYTEQADSWQTDHLLCF